MSQPNLPLPFFHTKKERKLNFHSIGTWLPFVYDICAREQLIVNQLQEIPVGHEGSNPVFVVDDQFVVKLYTHISEDDDADVVFEREITSSKVLAYGNL